MDMSVEVGSLTLKNPVMVAAGPWSGSLEGICKCIEFGAGAVVTETIAMETHPALHPYFHANGTQLFNIRLYSDLYLEQWEKSLAALDKRGAKLIVSISGETASEVRYLAACAERMGADAIELSLSAPVGMRYRSFSTYPERTAKVVEAAVKAADLPVFIKLPYEASYFPGMLQSLYDAGAKAVTAIDALKSLNGVDLENRQTYMPTFGGYSANNIRPVSLAVTAMLKQYTPFQIFSCGGISTAEHALEFIMLGADAIQLASAIHMEGYKVIGDVLHGLTDWMADHDVSDFSKIRGAALPSLRPFEEIRPRPVRAKLLKACAAECDICLRGCIYGAISRQDGAITLNQKACVGCGYCLARCPEKKLNWDWI
jgi:dihydroorotate dehydrogenase/NAD-dependent dihydropyrimidine dehydrogenase PreA subunit